MGGVDGLVRTERVREEREARITAHFTQLRNQGTVVSSHWEAGRAGP